MKKLFTFTLTQSQVEKVQKLCDIALRVGGLDNLGAVMELLAVLKTGAPVEFKQPPAKPSSNGETQEGPQAEA